MFCLAQESYARNKSDIEKIQKSAFRLIIEDKYTAYEKAMSLLDMDSSKDKRELLFTKFTFKSIEVKQMNNILREITKIHTMPTIHTL